MSIVAFFFTPILTPDQRDLVRFLFALLTGFASLFLGGTCLLKLGWPKNNAVKLSLSATGGVAVFLFTYLYPPYWHHKSELPPGDSVVAISSLRVKDQGPGLALLDVTLRNRGSVDAVVHGGELIVQKAKIITLGSHPLYLPSTHQYNVAIPASTGVFPLELSQVVPAGGVDRFQIIFVLGNERAGESLLGSARIGWIMGKDGTKVTHMQTRSVLNLHIDEGNVLQTAPFDFTLYAPGFGFKARTIAGHDLSDKRRVLLEEKDVNVVESIVENLATIGGEEALTALRDLQSRDRSYLQKYYEEKVHRGNLPSPSERIAEFEHTLDEALKYLEAAK